MSQELITETSVSIETTPSLRPSFTRDIRLAMADARSLVDSPSARIITMGLIIAGGVLLPQAAAFAQTSTFDPTKLNQGVQTVVNAIHIICAVLVPLLFAAGFGTLMYSGFSDNFRRIAIRVLSFAIVGVIALFLLADPLAQLVVSTTGCTDSNGSVTCPTTSGQ